MSEKPLPDATITAAVERERLRMAYVLMTRVFLHVSAERRQEAMQLLRWMHDDISAKYGWPMLESQRGD